MATSVAERPWGAGLPGHHSEVAGDGAERADQAFRRRDGADVAGHDQEGCGGSG